MSCGLKNSGCSGSSTNSSSDELPAWVDDGLPQRFLFVDGDTGRWSSASSYSQATIECPVHSIMVFHYPQYAHDVTQLASDERNYETCNFTDAVQVSPLSDGTTFEQVTYYYNCSEPNTTAYFACSVPGHCQLAQQRMKVHTSATDFAYNATTGDWIAHVRSLGQVLRLLGYRETENDLYTMDRGFQTEKLANITTDLIWCALDECPGFARDVSPNATLEDCESIVYSLLGFVNRKRPIPQWDVAEKYYDEAIKRKGFNECTSRGYKSELYLLKGDYVKAEAELGDLCRQCQGNKDDFVSIRQARNEYDTLSLTRGINASVVWPASCDSKSFEATTSGAHLSVGHSLHTVLTLLIVLLCFKLR
jgi:hypothetical protein